LVRREVRLNGIAAAPDTTLRLNDRDGGIDGRVSWSGEPERTARLPARLVVWQSKSGRLLTKSEFVREIERRDGADLKPRVREALLGGGAYVIFCAADMTAEQKDIRTAALCGSVRQFLPGIEPRISIVAGDDIAAWASEDLWARTFLTRAAGREQPGLLLTFDEWAQQPGLDNKYIWSDETRRVAADICAQVESGGVYRLDGSPGLGKTRLALEALRPLAQSGFGVTYFNARYVGSGQELVRALPSWRRFNVGGILVVDDCDAALHEQIASAVATSDLAAITIDYRHEMTANRTLRACSADIIDQIVRSHPFFPSDPRDLGESTAKLVARIVTYAEGWPLMAIMVLRHVVDRMDNVVELNDDQLTRRLIDDPNEPDAVPVLRVLSLFDHVGFRDDVEREWETVRTLLVPRVPHDKFYRIVKAYERKDLVFVIGRYWRVTPPPLAIRLVREWLRDSPPALRDRLFGDLPASLTESVADRLRHTSTPAAVEMARQLLAPGGRFGILSGILGRSNSKIFRALAEVDPESALDALNRNLGVLSDEDLQAIDERIGRQNLVWALEGIAFHQGHFKAAARLLFALARNENATNSNNSRGTFRKIFNLQGSQTEASPADRIEIIREALQREDAPSLAVAAEAISAILSSQPSSIILGVEWQGGRPELKEWKPQTWEEVFEYERAGVECALRLATKGTIGFELAKDAVAAGTILLIRHRRWDDLNRAVEPFRGGAWPKAIENLTWMMQHGIESGDTESRSRTKAVIDSLIPSTLRDRLSLFVSEAPHNLEERGPTVVDVSVEQVEQFAKETVEAGQVRQALNVLSSGFHRLAYAYSAAVAETTENLAELADHALEAYSAAETPRSDVALAGIMAVIYRRDPRLRNRVLDQIATDKRLADALPILSSHPDATPADVERLARAITGGILVNPPRRFTFAGKALASIESPAVRQLASILIDKGWYASAAEALLFGIDRTDDFDDLFARIILESNFIRAEMPDLHDWSMFEVAKRIINGGDVVFSVNIARQMIDLALSDADFNRKRRVSDLWPHLLSQPDVWTEFCRSYAHVDERLRWKLLYALHYIPPGTAQHRLALDVVQMENLMQFAQENSTDVPAFLAHHGHIVDEDRDGGLSPTPLLVALLKTFGGAQPVLQSLSANLHSFASVGPRAGYYARRVDLVDKIPTLGSAPIAAWKETLRATFQSERRQTEAHDQELHEGLF
jgi:hypothetical protein